MLFNKNLTSHRSSSSFYFLVSIFLLSSSSFYFLVSAPIAQAAVLRNPPNNLGLVGYWKFDDATGTIATDFSGKGNSGILLSMDGSNWIAGKTGTALNFGGNASADRVDLGNGTIGSAIDGASASTVSVWLRYSTLESSGSNAGNIFLFSAFGTGTLPALGLNIDNSSGNVGKIWSGARSSTSNGQQQKQSTGALSADAWHHLVVVNDYVANQTTIYIDGSQDSQQTSYFDNQAFTYAGTPTVSDAIAAKYPGGASFNGQLDDVRIYNRGLSATEVENLYNAGAPVIKVANSNGLVGYWSFEDATGTKATDFSGNGNTGTLTNMEAADWVQGKRGKALSFDGSDEYVDLGTSAGNFNNTDSFSVSAWINANTLNSTNRCIVNRVTGSPANGWEMRITTANKVRFLLASTSANYNGQDTTVLSTNTWYHVVGTWNGSDAKIFLNGVEDTSTPITQNSVGTITGTRTLAVGANAITSSSYFPGSIDDVRIYNRALSATEVSALYNSGATTAKPTIKTVSRQGLVGYWSFEDGTSTKATDFSGNGNTGTLTNMEAADWVAGKRGKALSFDGTNDYVDAGAATSLHLTTALTISSWVKTNSLAASAREVVAKSGGYYWLGMHTAKARFLTFTGGNDTLDSNASLVTDRWYHLVGTWSTTDNTLRLYIDGVLDNSLSSTGNISDNAAANLLIGGDATVTWNGSIDEVRIYNRALSPAEVLQLYNVGR